MSIFRSYFAKNNTLIDNNQTNNSQNPVTEISYGTYNKQVSRFIFDVDLTSLQEKVSKGLINPNRIVKHVLHMTNTISYAPQYIGKKSYTENIDRASSFELEVYNIKQDWDEGSGYDFIYNDTTLSSSAAQAANWYSAKTTTFWNITGSYENSVNEVIGRQRFEVGNENLDIDVTDYINQRLFSTGYTGTSVYSGVTYGLGLKFTDAYEQIETENRKAVAFHAKKTNTFYEPYIETIVDDLITDDRNYFYLDKDNDLYLYTNIGSINQNIVINQVNIYDNNDSLVLSIPGNSVVNVSKGVYKITLNIDSELYPDAVLFRDEWVVTINGKQKKYNADFYLISEDKYITFNRTNYINFDNYFFYFWGISEKENIGANNVRKIKLTIKELYPNQNNNIPLEIEYRLFTNIDKKHEIDIIPFTLVNRTNTGYEFDLDTSWLIPQDYKLQIRMKNGDYYENKQTVSFTVVSNGIIF